MDKTRENNMRRPFTKKIHTTSKGSQPHTCRRHVSVGIPLFGILHSFNDFTKGSLPWLGAKRFRLANMCACAHTHDVYPRTNNVKKVRILPQREQAWSMVCLCLPIGNKDLGSASVGSTTCELRRERKSQSAFDQSWRRQPPEASITTIQLTSKGHGSNIKRNGWIQLWVILDLVVHELSKIGVVRAARVALVRKIGGRLIM